MTTFYISIIFLLGLAVGSFINALVYRVEEKKSINGRSFCPHCKYQLRWYDLVPVLSWLFLRGKCRECKKSISMQYPLVELATGILFAAYYYFDVPSALYEYISLLLGLIIISIFIIIAVYDYRTKYVLSNYIYVGMALSMLLILINYQGDYIALDFLYHIFPYLLSAFIPAAFFYSLYFFSKGEWMGEGDTEIALLIGLFLGFPKTLVAYYIAFIAGALFGIASIYLKKLNLKSEVPFGPFLVLGTMIALFYGEKIFEIYVKIILGG